jgi:hypothetical protein
MRKRFMDKGSDMGLWKAEDFSAEDGDGEEVSIPKRDFTIPFLSSLRDDTLTLGSLCLSVTAGAAGIFTKESLVDNTWKSVLRYASIGLGAFALGRITRNGDVNSLAETFAQERNMMEQVLDKMEHDIEEIEEEAATNARKQVLDVGGGMLNAFHATMGPSLTSSNNAYTTRAHGQDPFSQIRY